MLLLCGRCGTATEGELLKPHKFLRGPLRAGPLHQKPALLLVGNLVWPCLSVLEGIRIHERRSIALKVSRDWESLGGSRTARVGQLDGLPLTSRPLPRLIQPRGEVIRSRAVNRTRISSTQCTKLWSLSLPLCVISIEAVHVFLQTRSHTTNKRRDIAHLCEEFCDLMT